MEIPQLRCGVRILEHFADIIGFSGGAALKSADYDLASCGCGGAEENRQYTLRSLL